MRTSDELIKSVKEYKNGNVEAFNSIYEQSYGRDAAGIQQALCKDLDCTFIEISVMVYVVK